MKPITELLSEVAQNAATAKTGSKPQSIDQAWLDAYTASLIEQVTDCCANHVKNMPSRGGFRFAESASYVNHADVVKLIKSVFNHERV